jgi:hypothetical protein
MRTLLLTLLIALPLTSFAHGGRLNAEGCHNNSKTGQYECHKTVESKPVKTEARSIARTGARDYNCSDFYGWEDAQGTFERAGGPLVDPYDLDRDSDGIACESLR